MLIIQHTIEEQTLYDKILAHISNKEISNPFQDLIANKEKKRKLATILKDDSLSEEEMSMFLRPWYRANILASWWRQFNWSKSKEKAKAYLTHIEKFEEELESDEGDINQLMLLLIASHLDANKLLYILRELKEFFNIILSFNFGRGKPYNADYFIRYAINSLFYMGNQLGLKADGSSCSIHKYIKAITERDYETINEDHSDYKKINFLTMYQEIRNIPIQFIYNPICKNTYETLGAIKRRRILKKLNLTSNK